MVADLVAESERKTGERLGRQAEAFLVPILERVDQKEAARPTKSRSPANEQFQEQAAKAGIEGRVERLSQPSPIMSPRAAESKADRLLRDRVRWMNQAPEYKTQIQQVWTKLKFKLLTPHQAERKFWDLVHKSDQHLGRPWWKEERRIQVG